MPPRLAEQLYQREVGAHPSKAREVHVNSCKLGILFWKLNKGGWQLQRVGGRAQGRAGGRVRLMGVTYAASAHGAWWAEGSPWALIC